MLVGSGIGTSKQEVGLSNGVDWTCKPRGTGPPSPVAWCAPPNLARDELDQLYFTRDEEIEDLLFDYIRRNAARIIVP